MFTGKVWVIITMSKIIQFVQKNAFGASLGAIAGLVYTLIYYNTTGVFFALEPLLPGVEPMLISGAESLLWAVLVGTMAGILIDHFINLKKVFNIKW